MSGHEAQHTRPVPTRLPGLLEERRSEVGSVANVLDILQQERQDPSWRARARVSCSPAGIGGDTWAATVVTKGRSWQVSVAELLCLAGPPVTLPRPVASGARQDALPRSPRLVLSFLQFFRPHASVLEVFVPDFPVLVLLGP